MKEMQALVDELKEKENNNQGGFQKEYGVANVEQKDTTKKNAQPLLHVPSV